MEIDYQELIQLIRIRLRQIYDISLVDDEYNIEYNRLTMTLRNIYVIQKLNHVRDSNGYKR